MKLRDIILWYIDGHHSAFDSRSLLIPDVIWSFSRYNTPEVSKHQKRVVGNMSYDILVSHVAFLKESLLCSCLQQRKWAELKSIIDKLASSIDDYTLYLRQQTGIVKAKQAATSISDSSSLKVLPRRDSPVRQKLQPPLNAIEERQVYEYVHVNDYAPSDPKFKYQYIRDLEKGLPFMSVLYTCTSGMNYHYIWRLPEGVMLESATGENVRIVEKIKTELLSYHSRSMQKAFFDKCGRIAPGVKPHFLRQIYRDLTGIIILTAT